SNSPHATIAMRDGTTLTGTVKSTTPVQITLSMDSGGDRTVLTKDVKSVEYGEGAAANKPASAPVDAPKNARATPEAASTPGEPAAAARPEPRYRPDKTAIQTKTF